MRWEKKCRGLKREREERRGVSRRKGVGGCGLAFLPAEGAGVRFC